MKSIKRLDGQTTMLVKVRHGDEVVREKAAIYPRKGKFYVKTNGEYTQIIEPREISSTTDIVYI